MYVFICCLSIKSTSCNEMCFIKIATAIAICSTQVVYKVWDYRCLLSFIVSFWFSPHGPHTVCSECDERQWVIDAHGASTHLLCPQGRSFEGYPTLWRGAGVWKAAVGTRQGNSTTLKLQLSPALHHRVPLFLQPHQTVLRRGLFMGRAVDELQWAFGCPETWLLIFMFSCTCELKINEMIKV